MSAPFSTRSGLISRFVQIFTVGYPGLPLGSGGMDKPTDFSSFLIERFLVNQRPDMKTVEESGEVSCAWRLGWL